MYEARRFRGDRTPRSTMPTAADCHVVHLCERGIAACRAGDAAEVRRVFIQLIAALDFDYRVAARRLVQVYEQCIRRARRGDFEVPMLVLEWLRAPGSPGAGSAQPGAR
jgi:hypothetical protein